MSQIHESVFTLYEAAWARAVRCREMAAEITGDSDDERRARQYFLRKADEAIADAEELKGLRLTSTA